MEVNAIIPRLSSSSRRKISFPKTLIKKLDVDHRIVLDWNIDHADMDLFVIEPTGETSDYGNDLTEIGGQLSNDMTEGYGPEQYLLRQAIKGNYQVGTDFFSASEYDPNGAVSVRIRMTKNFARRGQTTKTVIAELKEENEDEPIGEFIVK